MIYITSDTHFGHRQDFLYTPRGFISIEEMDNKIIENWNNIVKPDDIVYHLGDVMLNDNNIGIECLKRLNGKICIIRGNHDTDTRLNLYSELPNVFSCGEWAKVIKYGKFHFYLSHYPTLTANFDDGKFLNKKVISLCGHSHYQNRFKDMNKGLIYHVECDAHNCTPVSIEQIINDIKTFISLDKYDQIKICENNIY